MARGFNHRKAKLRWLLKTFWQLKPLYKGSFFFFEQKDNTVFAWRTSLVCPPLEEECSFSDGSNNYNLQLLTSRTRSWYYEHNKDRYLLPSSLFLSLAGHWGFYKSTSYLLFPFASSFSFCLLNCINFIPISTCFSFSCFLKKNAVRLLFLCFTFFVSHSMYIFYIFFIIQMLRPHA